MNSCRLQMTEEERNLLTSAIQCAEDPPDQMFPTNHEAANAFRDMLARGYSLSPKQRAWAARIVNGMPSRGIWADDIHPDDMF